VSSVLESELRADGVADHGERYPRAYQEAVAAHEAAAVGEGEEGAPELFEGAAALAEAVAGGQIEHPDANDGEGDYAGDPDVGCDVVVMDAGEKEAADHRDEEGTDGSEQLRRRGVWVGMVQGHGANGDREQDDSNERMSQEPESLAAKFAHGFIVRDVSSVDHVQAKVTPSKWLWGWFLLRLSWHVRFD